MVVVGSADEKKAEKVISFLFLSFPLFESVFFFCKGGRVEERKSGATEFFKLESTRQVKWQNSSFRTQRRRRRRRQDNVVNHNRN